MIEVIELAKHYHEFKAVDNISFSVPTGQTLALVGTSGCGKTTTLKMINRLIEPSGGQVLVNGKDTLEYNPVELRREIGYVIQDIGLFPHYTIEENIGIVPKLLGWSAEKNQKRVLELMERLKLSPEENRHKYPHQLSGGQQQRVGIARALAADPPIILMDEAFGALDPITRKDLRKDFRELEELSRKTTIMVTHDIEEAFEMADLICVLDKGQVQQLGTPKELLFQTSDSFTRQFLSDKLMQLEFQSLQIVDLFDQLPDMPSSKKVSIEISPSTSIFDAIAQFTRQTRSDVVAKTPHQDRSKHYNLNDLIEAFQQVLITERRH